MTKRILLILGIFCLVFLAPIKVLAQEYIVVPAFAFNGWEGDETFRKQEGTYSFLYTRISDNQYLFAPVYFPASADGLRVRSMAITINDGIDTGGIIVRLSRLDHTTGRAKTVFLIDTGDTETPGMTTLYDGSGSFKSIQNNRYGWYLFVRFDKLSTSLRLHSIRIKYQ